MYSANCKDSEAEKHPAAMRCWQCCSAVKYAQGALLRSQGHLLQQCGVSERLLHHAFAQLRDKLGDLAHTVFILGGKEKGRRNGQCTRSPKVSFSARMRAFSSAENSGANSTSGRSNPCHNCAGVRSRWAVPLTPFSAPARPFSGAPVKPAAAPTPRISSQPGAGIRR